MQTTPITISKTEASVDALRFAHRWVLKKAPITEEQWITALYENGYKFATDFARMFPGTEQQIEDLLIKSPVEPGFNNNRYWMWWKLKYMQDDWEYINCKVWQQPVSYAQYKCYMHQCEILQRELLNLLEEVK